MKRLDDLLANVAVYAGLAILLPLTALVFICIEVGTTFDRGWGGRMMTAVNRRLDRIIHWMQETFHMLRGLYPDGGSNQWPSK